MATLTRLVLRPDHVIYLVNLAVGVSVICAVGLVALRACRCCSAPVRYGILLCVLALALACPVSVWLGQHEGWALFPLALAGPHTVGQSSVSAITPPPADPPGSVGTAPPPSGQEPSGSFPPTPSLPAKADSSPPRAVHGPTLTGVADVRSTRVASLPPPADRGRDKYLWWQVLGTCAACAWAIGILAGVLRLGLGYAALRRIRTSFREPGAHVAQLGQRVAERLQWRRAPALYLSPLTPVPLSLGLIQPAVVLPADMAPRMEEIQLEAILVHEMAHLIRRDLWVGLAQRLALVVFWWNPLVRRVAHGISALAEDLCDNYVVRAQGGGEDFARTLVDLARHITVRPGLPATVGVLEPSLDGLTERVHRLLGKDRDMPTRMSFGSAVLILTCGLAAFLSTVLIHCLRAAEAVTAPAAVAQTGPDGATFGHTGAGAVPLSAAEGATYCVDGDNPGARDTNPGTEAQPWKTISRATGLLQPGDTLLVKAGTYRETVTLTQSGTAAQPITIQAYPGHEGKAILNAAEPLTTWRQCTGPDDCHGNPNWSHIYYAEVADLVAAHPDKAFAVRQLFQHGELLPRSRYPDKGWSYPTAIVQPKTTFGDATLSKPAGYFNGAVCHIKTAVWWVDQIPIASFSDATIVLAASPQYEMSEQFGYYVTSIVGEINEEGEWAYEPARKRIYLWPKGDVAEGVEFTYRDDCLRTAAGLSFNVVRGLTMRNAWGYGIRVCQSHDLVLENNTMEYSYISGLRLQTEGGTCDNNQVLRNTVRYSCSSGINIDSLASNYRVEGNYVYATGVEHFGGDLMNGNGYGLFLWGRSGRVRYNRIDRTGNNALYMANNPLNREMAFNYITNTALATSDAGGIYTGGFYDGGPEKDHIHHNIIKDTIGCNTMTKWCDTGLPATMEKYAGGSAGIYVDEEGNHRLIEHNTVVNSYYAGLFFHGAPGNLVRNNTCYGNREMQALLVGRAYFGGRTRDRMRLVDDILQDNILFATEARQRTLRLTMHYDDIHFGQSDQNYFYNPYANAHIYVERSDASEAQWSRTLLSLDQWRALSGYDGNSKDFSYLSRLPQVTLASPTKSRIVYNASLDVNTVDLGPDRYCDMQGNGVPGRLTLQPFESKVLIAVVAAVVPRQAANPVPPDGGQTGVLPVLQWTPAAEAAFHNVYVGADRNAVEAANVTSTLYRGRQTEARLPLHGLVPPGSRCFWRVDEVEADGTTIHKGVVWTCTVPHYLVIDDFESYTDNKGTRTRKNQSLLEDTWTGGASNDTGAQVGLSGNSSTTWTDNAHGQKSLSLVYDNARPPFTSAVGREFSPPQDWTAGAVSTLSLWVQGDIVSFDEPTPGTFSMSALGTDIWDARDEFRYAWQRLDGDGTIVAKVEWLGGSDFWAKAGVMIRESLNPASAHASIFMIPSGVCAFQNRPANYTANCLSAQDWSELGFPCWIKLERKGDQFTGYHSADGIQWIRQSSPDADASPNPQTIPMPSSVYIGLALTSHAASVMTTARFSGVQTTGAVTGSWQVADIGVDHPGNSPDDLYVTIEDSDGKTATVVNPDRAAVNTVDWTQWRIPLHNFTGVDLSHVKRMSIGVGGRVGAAVRRDGRIYIDDIWVWKP
jgi:parallel beta-helix repeat protein